MYAHFLFLTQLLVSGGVDSTVCAALLHRALKKDQVIAVHIDNGFMRKNESALVEQSLKKIGLDLRGLFYWHFSKLFVVLTLFGSFKISISIFFNPFQSLMLATNLSMALQIFPLSRGNRMREVLLLK